LAGSKSGLAALQDFDPAYDRTGSKPEKLDESKCFPLFNGQRKREKPQKLSRAEGGI
jgi:hypothetical protein